MPIVSYSLRLIRKALILSRRDPACCNKVLCLAYPDVIASRDEVKNVFGQKMKDVPARKDGKLSLNWHKAHNITDEVLDTKSMFKELGYEMDSFDIVTGRGGEMIHDLSHPLPPLHHAHNSYDLVFDCISNQVFNVAQAWWTMIQCCRVGGYIISVTPVQMVNQGFWNVSPAAYEDFFTANGMKVERQSIVGVYSMKDKIKLDPMIRERHVPDDTMNVVFMKKLREQHKPIWPVMSKFKKHPKCQIGAEKGSPL